jgi:hypothetical protein
VLKKLEEKLKLREVPEFFKHAESDPADILEEHSPKTAHLTIALAIALWKEHGQVETAAMREFSKLPDPYKPGHRASYVLTVAGGRSYYGGTALRHYQHSDCTRPTANRGP